MHELASALPTDHARQQCTRRGLSWEMVRSVLREPEAILPLRPGRNRVVVQARRAVGAAGLVSLARVFVDIVRRPPEVVTVYRTTAFIRHGSPPP